MAWLLVTKHFVKVLIVQDFHAQPSLYSVFLRWCETKDIHWSVLWIVTDEALEENARTAWSCVEVGTDLNWHRYTSNWQISYRAHYLICFRLPTLNLHLQAVLQPTSTVAPLFSFINVMPEVTHTNAATRFPLRSLAINKCNP